MFRLFPFQQSRLLQGISDPDVQGGVCVALCDHWFKGLKEHSGIAPDVRLHVLAGQIDEVVLYQRNYGRQRAANGPFSARRNLSSRLGLDYEEQTTISRNPMHRAGSQGAGGMQGIRHRLAEDLERPFSGATWSMRFSQAAGGGGHAIAGFNLLCATSMSNMHVMEMHVFDPNIGEYSGTYADLDEILTDLFGKFPDYAHVEEVRRSTEG